MNITKSVIELRGKLIECINTSGLPPVVAGLVLDGVKNDVEKVIAMEFRKDDTDGRNERDDGTESNRGGAGQTGD